MIASVDVLFAPPYSADALRDAHVVVVDVLRATTTVATALANGAAGIVPVLTPEDALDVARRLGRERVLLCGERDSVLIAGFDLDNSPASYTRARVAGKTLVLTTTNGTRALRAAQGARSLRTAALVDRAATAAALAREDGAVTILCAGLHGAFAFEDAVGAGALVDGLLAHAPGIALGDGARAATLLFRAVAPRLADAIASAEHAARLAELGFVGDLAIASALDSIANATVERNSVLVSDGAGAQSTGLDVAEPARDAAAELAERLEETLPEFRTRYKPEYALRGSVNAALLTGSLHAYVATAFRERRGDEALRDIGKAFEAVLERAGGDDVAAHVTEDFFERVADWAPAQRDALRRELGPRAGRLLGSMELR